MNGVIGMLDLLANTHLNSRQQHYVRVIRQSGEALLNIINDILDFSKIEAGKLELATDEFNLEELIEDCSQLFSISASDKGLNFVVAVAPALPAQLRGDPMRLRQILINLLGNAFKFTTEGHIVLAVRCERIEADGRALIRCSVTDTGIGIDEEHQRRLFSPFEQADTTTTRRFGGTGLGLAICRRLIALMGGEIGVNSSPGRGSEFWFTVPLAVSERRDREAADMEAVVSRHLRGRRLLLVDDDPLFVEVISEHLTRWQLQLQTCATAAAAQALLTRADAAFDLALVDVRLPDMDGRELCRWLRQQPQWARLPVLLVTAAAETLSAAELHNCGASQGLHKPLSPHRLRLALAEALGLAQLASRREWPLPSFAGLRVLVAEDNDVNRQGISAMLKKLETIPVLVNNGVAAVQAYRDQRGRFDVIFMDCEMPEMDGFEASRCIRRMEAESGWQPVWIVALTAQYTTEHRERIFAAGMDQHLAKPVTLQQVAAALQPLRERAAPAVVKPLRPTP
jgi:CheY-like chemotaxis protein